MLFEAETSNDAVITAELVSPFGAGVMLIVIRNDVEAAACGSTGSLQDKGIICFI